MGYLSVGSSHISPELFLNVKNTDGSKPSGGIWATKHNPLYKSYNEWIDYLCNHPHILYYHGFSNPYNLPAMYITLKEESNIFSLDSTEKLSFLKTNYSLDYEKLANDYDGIYVNIKKLSNYQDKEITSLIEEFCVSTLILFNINCIKHYQEAYIDLRDASLKGGFHQAEYQIEIDNKLHKIDSSTPEIEYLIESIKEYIRQNNINPENTKAIEDIYQNAIDELLKKHNIHKKEMLLIRKVFNQF